MNHIISSLNLKFIFQIKKIGLNLWKDSLFEKFYGEVEQESKTVEKKMIIDLLKQDNML